MIQIDCQTGSLIDHERQSKVLEANVLSVIGQRVSLNESEKSFSIQTVVQLLIQYPQLLDLFGNAPEFLNRCLRIRPTLRAIGEKPSLTGDQVVFESLELGKLTIVRKYELSLSDVDFVSADDHGLSRIGLSSGSFVKTSFIDKPTFEIEESPYLCGRERGADLNEPPQSLSATHVSEVYYLPIRLMNAKIKEICEYANEDRTRLDRKRRSVHIHDQDEPQMSLWEVLETVLISVDASEGFDGPEHGKIGKERLEAIRDKPGQPSE